MLKSLFHPGVFALGAVLAALGTALALGLAISLIYRVLSRERGGFPVVLAVMPALVAAVILIVNGSLGASVAVLGAFGLVRFRSATGTAWEIGALFFSMAAGLACGMGYLTLAALITAVVGAALLALHLLGFASGAGTARSLRVTIPEDLEYDGVFDDLFQEFTRSARLEQVKTTGMGTMYELSYRVVLRSAKREKAFLDAIRCRNGNLTVAIGLAGHEKNTL